MVNLKINNVEVSVEDKTTILDAARQIGINIPTLCFLEHNKIGACRMCVVEVKGSDTLRSACNFPVKEGMEVFTNSPKVRESRKNTLELTLSDHNRDCTTCLRSGNCELQSLANDLGVSTVPFKGDFSSDMYDDKSLSVVRDESKCIYCKRCINTCSKIQGIGALIGKDNGFDSKSRPVKGDVLADTNCINCGQCIVNCPVGALTEKVNTDEVWEALSDDSKHVVVQPAPAVRAALGEEFGYEIGTDVTGKMVASMKRLGFNKVFDTDFGADMTIMEEAHELVDRLSNGGVLPMVTSCCPAWVKMCEQEYADLIPHLSSCKSPQAMTGALIKTHYAEVNNIDPKDIYVVSVMPCVAKKFEVAREQLKEDDLFDSDVCITTRELAKMIKEAGIDFKNLDDEDFDPIYGESSGAGVIFGATGGVMEAAARTAVEAITGEAAQSVDYEAVRGLEGLKEATIKAGDKEIKVAVVHGGANIKKLMDKVRKGEADYDFIECMACIGGCVNGGGQPIVNSQLINAGLSVPEERAKVLYNQDKNVRPCRKSHENPSVQKVYNEYLGKPNSHKAHEILHTTYVDRSNDFVK